MNKYKKYIPWVLLASFVIIQFFPIDKENPEVDPKQDFLVSNRAPVGIAKMIKASCYDCHSNETTYPWYSNVAPASFFLAGHVKNGRKHLNYSTWETYSIKKKDHKIEEIVEMIEKKWMPMSSYGWLHPEGRLDDNQRKEIIQFFRSLQ